MIIAVTRNDESNMIVCQLANYLMFQKIARIRTKDFLEKAGKIIQQIKYTN